MLKFGHEYHDNQYNTIYQVRPGLGGPDKGYAVFYTNNFGTGWHKYAGRGNVFTTKAEAERYMDTKFGGHARYGFSNVHTV